MMSSSEVQRWVAGESKLLTSICRTHPGVRTQSTEMGPRHTADPVELAEEARHSKSRHVSHDDGVIRDRHTSNFCTIPGVETELFFNSLQQDVPVNPSLLNNFRGRGRGQV